MPLSDTGFIRRQLTSPIVDPFYPVQVKIRQGAEYLEEVPVISYGLGSYGYDIRVGNNFKVFTSVHCKEVDPKKPHADTFVDMYVKDGDYLLIPPNSFALAESVETIDVPRDILVICIGKSTYARCGVIVNVTPLEPEWRGTITLEISNTTPLPARIYAGEGILQLVFLEASEMCKISYKDRLGKYQDQSGITLAKV